MSLIYTYIFKHYFVLKKLNETAFFHKIFATKSFILGCVCGAVVAHRFM